MPCAAVDTGMRFEMRAATGRAPHCLVLIARVAGVGVWPWVGGAWVMVYLEFTCSRCVNSKCVRFAIEVRTL